MSFEVLVSPEARATLNYLRAAALKTLENRKKSGKSKASKQEGLYKQVSKALRLLAQDPKHPGLQTHAHSGYTNPFNSKAKVFEAYAQQHTPGAWRVFWCHGPKKSQITIIAIVKHPD